MFLLFPIFELTEGKKSIIMKTTLTIEADSEAKLQLLIRVAEEMGMAINSNPLPDECTIVSESVLAEDWNSPEDERWDEMYAHLKK